MPQSTTLRATYSSPANAAFDISKPLPSISSESSTDDKTQYLAALRDAVTQTQAEVNKELTSRMEEDKAAAAAGANGATPAVDEDKEEENYGEEVQEDAD